MCEAEDFASASTIQGHLNLQNSLGNIEKYEHAQMIVHEDHRGTIALTKNPVNRRRGKHADRKYHFFRSSVTEERATLVFFNKHIRPTKAKSPSIVSLLNASCCDK